MDLKDNLIKLYEDIEIAKDKSNFNRDVKLSVHSPSRPFMRQSVENHVDEITQACGAAAKAVGSGQMSAQQALSSIGDMLVGVTQNEIRDGEFEPNAPSTIRKKGSSKPLIDSSHMRQSVHFFIKEADE